MAIVAHPKGKDEGYHARHYTCRISSLYYEAFDISMKHTTVVIITRTERQKILQTTSIEAQYTTKLTSRSIKTR